MQALKLNLESLVEGLRSNDEAIGKKTLYNGFEICLHRTELFDALLGNFFDVLLETYQPQYKFFIGAVGGYGRRHLRPNSDLDLILIHEDDVADDDLFLVSYAGLSDTLHRTLGISASTIINRLSDLDKQDKFDATKFSALFDCRRLKGSEEFEKKFLENIKSSMNQLEFFLHAKSALEESGHEYTSGIDNVPFNLKYGVGGLRQFSLAINILGAEKFESSLDVYKRIAPHVVKSYGVLLKASSWLNLRHGLNRERLGKKVNTGIAENDIFSIEDLKEFERYFGSGSLDKIYESRLAVKQFAEKTVYERKVIQSDFVYTINGLQLNPLYNCRNNNELLYRLLFEAQRRDINIDTSTKHNFIANASNFAKCRPEFLGFFQENGNLPKTLEILLEAGALGKILPGFSTLQTSYFEETHRNRGITRARQAINRVSNFDSLSYARNSQSSQKRFFGEEYELLTSDQKVSLRMALLCKAIPQTLDIPTLSYLAELKKNLPGLSNDSMIIIEFLIDNKDLLFSTAQTELLMEKSTIDLVVDKIKDIDRLRSLLLFTYADLDGTQTRDKHFIKSGYLSRSDWDNLIFLYRRIKGRFNGEEEAYYRPEELDDKKAEVAKFIPFSFFRSRYKDPLAINLGYVHDVISSKEPKIILEQRSENYFILKVISEDFPGLLWRVAGICHKHKANITQAEIYSLTGHYNIAMDFFEINAQEVHNIPSFNADLESVLREKKDVEINAQQLLRKIKLAYRLEYYPNDEKFRLSIEAQDQRGLLYAVSRTLSEKVGVDIRTTKVYTSRSGRINDIIFFTSDKPVPNVEDLVAQNFGLSNDIIDKKKEGLNITKY